MANLSTIRMQVLNLVANNSMIAAADATALIQAEHLTLLGDYSWSFRKADTIILAVGTTTTGTVQTSGTTLIGTGGAVFTSSMVGRFVRIGTNTFFYRITAFTDSTHMTMEAAMPVDVSTSTAYTIFQHLYDLPSDFGRVTNVTSNVRLVEWSRNDIDRTDPYRVSTATRPDVYSIHGLDPAVTTSQLFQIEFWPVPSSAQAIRIEYLKTNTLSADTDMPLYRSDVLVWKAAESAAFFLHGKTGDQAWLVLADRYHQRYGEALQGAREDDIARFVPAAYVRDHIFDLAAGRGDDYFMDKDSLRLR